MTAANQSLQRVADIKETKANLEQVSHWLNSQQAEHELAQQRDKEIAQSMATLNQQSQSLQEQVIQLQQQVAVQNQAVEQGRKQHQQVIEAQSAISEEAETLQMQLEELLIEQEMHTADLPVTDDTSFEQQNTALEAQIVQIKSQVSQTQQRHHQCAIEVEQARSKVAQHQQNLTRLQSQSEQAMQMLEEKSLVLEELAIPLMENEEQLQLWLASMVEVDEKLLYIQQNLSSAQAQVDKLDAAKQQTNEQILALKEQVTNAHVEAENHKVRAEGALETLDEMQVRLKDVQAMMPVEAKESLWQANLVKLAKDISRLGAINLAAIDEYEQQLERKEYLDKQDDDLNQAIETLEAAIAKIDKETRQKFKITFDQVNGDLQTLFPKVFGGGSAYLELTSDDMLDTGVTIMARPPGKKNSTIHLLSGGEKALTALSLVFAIFRLNPAPFCMLDEVDAPLDDANVGRFCNLVREMSQTVQFVYISHNKIAMEMASHLTGVTMFEPGVSRMVAVDIDEALAMAELS